MKRLGEEDADGKIATSSDADGKMLPNEGKRRTANDNSEEKTSRSGDEEKDDNKEDASDSEDASPSLRLTAASTPTCWKLIQLIKKLKFTESDCKKIIGALEQSRDLSFLGTRCVGQEDPIKGPRCLPLAFPEYFTNDADVTEDLIATDQDKELWLRFAKANFKGTHILEETYPDESGQRLDLVSTLMGAYDRKNEQALQINVCSYSGHGISKEDAEELNTPGLAEYIYENQKGEHGIVEWNHLGYLSRVTRDNPSKFQFQVGDGILFPQNMQGFPLFVGIKDIASYWLEEVASYSNKFLVVVLDSCYSGGAAEVLATLLGSSGMASLSAIVIQYACRSDEYSYAGYFTPTFMRLQHQETRRVMSTLYEATKALPSHTWNGIMAEEPQQHIGLFVSSNSEDPPGFENESTHPTLYFENTKWPIALMLLATPGGSDVTIFNYWLTHDKFDTKLAIIPFKFLMNGETERASAHYHHNANGSLSCVNYFPCKQSEKTLPLSTSNPWFDKRSGKDYSHTVMADANGNLPDPHHGLYMKSRLYVTDAVWLDNSKWYMELAHDPTTYCFRGRHTLKRGQVEELALANVLHKWALKNVAGSKRYGGSGS
ncbi:hypothetical protein ON010_g11276 [Phytophthora cinnamomi]|nr:hypothetical protein ON010_g11276 [Phytophthora cinnamomi]